jgi:hypothetical protein
MNYVIIYCKYTRAFIDELPDSCNIKDTDGNTVEWTVQTTPVVKNDNCSLAMSVFTDDELVFVKTMKSIQSLRTYENMFADDEALAIYKSVYLYGKPVNYIVMDNTTKGYIRPQKIGEFAL